MSYTNDILELTLINAQTGKQRAYSFHVTYEATEARLHADQAQNAGIARRTESMLRSAWREGAGRIGMSHWGNMTLDKTQAVRVEAQQHAAEALGFYGDHIRLDSALFARECARLDAHPDTIHVVLDGSFIGTLWGAQPGSQFGKGAAL